MTSKNLMLNAAMTALAALAVPVQSSAQTYTTFDPPGSIATLPFAINEAGAITGFYVDMNGAQHGFLRAKDGTITTFDAPGASQGTVPAAINAPGAITGNYVDANGANHGFLRAVDGTITPFDAPGAGAGQFQGTTPDSINPGGVITGSYVDTNGGLHGFVRAKDGKVTTFDVGTIATVPASINPAGEITGNYLVNVGGGQMVPRGFVRSANGAITINFPSTFFEDTPVSINPSGTVSGTFSGPNGAGYFLRVKGGAVTTFDPSELGPATPLGGAINQEGALIGLFIGGNPTPLFESFLRTPDGNFTAIADPDAGTGFFQGTEATSINGAGDITGTYSDSNGQGHGFVRKP